MAERFEKLYTLPKNLYSEGAPVIVTAGALLRDTETGSVIVQLKYHSVSTMQIKALKVAISAYDVTGEEVKGVKDYQYLDLNIRNGEEFGANKAIILPDTVTRSFALSKVTVVFADGASVDVFTPMEPLPESKHLQTALNSEELIKQYRLEINNEAVCVPQKYGPLWCCSCGQWNFGCTCSACKASNEKAFSVLDMSILTANMKKRLDEEKIERQKQAEREETARRELEECELNRKAAKERRVKRIKKIIPVVCLIALLICALAIYRNFAKKNALYNSAVELKNTGNYQDALFAFSEIHDYKNSSDHMAEIIEILIFTDDDISIRKAVELLEVYPAGNEDVFELCQAIYRIEDNQYSLYTSYGTIYLSADFYLYNGKPYTNVSYENYLGTMRESTAISLSSSKDYLIEISVIGKFKDQTNTLTFNIGEDIATAQIDDGKTYELSFDHKLNKKEYVPRNEVEAENEITYQSANQLLGEKKYDQAIELYKKIVDYKDSAQKISEAEQAILSNRYIAAEQLLENGDQYAAALAFYELGDYKDAWTRSFGIWSGITHRDTIAAHEYNSVAIKADGTVVATGANWDDELEVDGWSNIVDISVGDRHTVGLKTDGTVVATGYDGNNRLSVGGWSGIVAIYTSPTHTLGLKADGTVVAVGNAEEGQCDVSDWRDIRIPE